MRMLGYCGKPVILPENHQMNKEERFHELLVKDCRGQTTEREKSELAILESARLSELESKEKHLVDALDKQISQLKELLGSMNHF